MCPITILPQSIKGISTKDTISLLTLYLYTIYIKSFSFLTFCVRLQYFLFGTEQGWNSGYVPQGLGPIPLRIEAEGLTTQGNHVPGSHHPPAPLPAGQSRYFHHYYDYINYQPVILDNTVFQVITLSCFKLNGNKMINYSSWTSY